MINKVLIDNEGNRYYYNRGDFHSDKGSIKEKDIINGKIKTNIGKELICFDSIFIDNLYKIKRGPAIINQKDIGIIIATTGISVNSLVLDAGSGSGALALNLANIGCKVTTYELRKDFYDLAKKNFEDLNFKIKIKNKDIYEGIEESELNLITLDLLEPWKVLKHAEKALKSGGFLVSYLPTITQVIELVKEINNYNLCLWKVSETIEREWHVEGLKVRPYNQILGHTAFLVFLRKY